MKLGEFLVHTFWFYPCLMTINLCFIAIHLTLVVVGHSSHQLGRYVKEFYEDTQVLLNDRQMSSSFLKTLTRMVTPASVVALAPALLTYDTKKDKLMGLFGLMDNRTDEERKLNNASAQQSQLMKDYVRSERIFRENWNSTICGDRPKTYNRYSFRGEWNDGGGFVIQLPFNLNLRREAIKHRCIIKPTMKWIRILLNYSHNIDRIHLEMLHWSHHKENVYHLKFIFINVRNNLWRWSYELQILPQVQPGFLFPGFSSVVVCFQVIQVIRTIVTSKFKLKSTFLHKFCIQISISILCLVIVITYYQMNFQQVGQNEGTTLDYYKSFRVLNDQFDLITFLMGIIFMWTLFDWLQSLWELIPEVHLVSKAIVAYLSVYSLPFFIISFHISLMLVNFPYIGSYLKILTTLWILCGFLGPLIRFIWNKNEKKRKKLQIRFQRGHTLGKDPQKVNQKDEQLHAGFSFIDSRDLSNGFTKQHKKK